MSDRAGEMMKRLMDAQVTFLTIPPHELVDTLRDARLLIRDLSLTEASAQNRAAELEREGGVPQSLRRIARTLELIAEYGPGRVQGE